MTILDQIDRVTSGLCPCGAPPADGSAYCSDDCRPTHISDDTDTRTSGDLVTAMRWRPDLVTEADDTDLIPLGSETHGYTGRFNAQVYELRSNPEVWHLRLDDGHRFVGYDLRDVGGRQDPIGVELVGRIRDAWRRLERDLTDPRRAAPIDRDPWPELLEVRAPEGWADLGFTTDDGLGAESPRWDVSAGTSAEFRIDNTNARFDVSAATNVSIFEQVREYARQFLIAERAPGRIETGWFVRQALSEHAASATSITEMPPLNALFGVSVVVVDNLHPCAWRLLDTDGRVLQEGRIETFTLLGFHR